MKNKILTLAVVAALGVAMVAPFGGNALATTTDPAAVPADIARAEALKATPEYQAALDSIKDYNKLQALNAAIESVNKQMPTAVIYWDMAISDNEINGNICRGYDARKIGMVGCVATAYGDLALQLAAKQGTISKVDTEYLNQALEAYKGKTFSELVALAKSNTAYTSDLGFRSIADQAQADYDRGTKALREDLLKIDSTLTGLDAKNGDALVALYETLPDVKAGTYSVFNRAYTDAMVASKYGDGMADEEIASAYALLTTAATQLDPNFKVDLANVAKLAVEKKPAAPNTGILGSEMTGTIAQIAVGLMAGVAAFAGIIVTAKRWFFSPLKRRK